MMATSFYNLSQYVDNRLAERLYADEIEWSGEELLMRRVRFVREVGQTVATHLTLRKRITG